MSVFGDVMSEAIQPALMGLLGDSILRYPAGNANQPVRIDAIWTEDDPRRQADYGDYVERTGTLKIDDAHAVSGADAWLISGQVWQTKTWDRLEGSFRHLRLCRKEPKNTRTTQPNLR